MSSYNIESVPARLVPFDWANLATDDISATSILDPAVGADALQMTEDELAFAQARAAAEGLTVGYSILGSSDVSISGTGVSGQNAPVDRGHPLYPLTLTGGLVFPYSPTISESIGIKYDTVELTHANEMVNAYRNTENVRISLSDCVWTSETFDMAVYTLAAIHFFRSYSLMDFGRRKPGTGRPPPPMWFYAYGKFLYHQLPVLIEKIEYSFPSDVDYVGVPNPGTDAFINQFLEFSTSLPFSSSSEYTWIPIKFTISSITLVVQHSVSYWTQEFDLDQFKAGTLVTRSQ